MISLEKKPIVIKYTQRLGDVIRMLPLARYYHDLGHDVYIDCFRNYADILLGVSYCKHFSEFEGGDFELIDLEIWKDNDTSRYNKFRDSGKDWFDFVYNDYPDVKQEIDFDLALDVDVSHYKLPSEYGLCFPCGESQIFRWDINYISSVALQFTEKYGTPMYFVASGDLREQYRNCGLKTIWAETILELPRIIREAKYMVTINTSASIIAGAVRNEPYYHFCEPSFDYQDDHKNDLQIRIEPKQAEIQS